MDDITTKRLWNAINTGDLKTLTKLLKPSEHSEDWQELQRKDYEAYGDPWNPNERWRKQ